MPHASEQLNLGNATTEPVSSEAPRHNKKILYATTKTQGSQIKKKKKT